MPYMLLGGPGLGWLAHVREFIITHMPLECTALLLVFVFCLFGKTAWFEKIFF